MREITNCPNCGAPISGIKCEYCGTLFFDMADVELYKDGFLRLKIDDKVMLCLVTPTSVTIDHSYNQAPEIELRFILKRVCDNVYFIEKEMHGDYKQQGGMEKWKNLPF